MNACCSACGLSSVPRPSMVVISLFSSRADRRDAGAHRLAVDQHRAGAALRQPAAELGAVELEIVAQHVEQRRVGLGRNRAAHAVDFQADGHGWRLPNAGAWRAVVVWNGFILRRRRRRVEALIGPRSSLGREPEPADQLALELVVGHRLRPEVARRSDSVMVWPVLAITGARTSLFIASAQARSNDRLDLGRQALGRE